jgi:hypothetical protein
MPLLRPQCSLHYVCVGCKAEFRFQMIEGPVLQADLAIALCCPCCGMHKLKLVLGALR